MSSRALGARRLADVRRGNVQRLVDSLTPEKSGSRVRTVVNSIRSLYAWAQDRELVDHDPASRVRLPAMNASPRDRVATVAEMNAPPGCVEGRGRPAVCACRVCHRKARGDPPRTRRGRRSRPRRDLSRSGRPRPQVTSGPACCPARQAACVDTQARSLMRRGRPGPGELLCPGHKTGGRNSGMLSFEGLQKRADDTWEPKDENGKPTGQKVGERITAHECRHTCASWLDAAGIRPVVVSQLMGHAAPVLQAGAAQITQERYTHALPGELERARARFEVWLADAQRAGNLRAQAPACRDR